MKNIFKNIPVVFIALMVSMTSCLEDPVEEFQIVGAVPTMILLSGPPPTVDPDGSFDISIRYYSPNVDVTGFTLTERIDDVNDVTKSESEVLTESVTGFDRSASYETSFTYTASNPALAGGDQITLTLTIQAANNLSNELVMTTSIPE